MNPTRIVIADDHSLVRSGLRLLMEAQGDVEVVGEADDAASALTRCQELQPDVLTLDLSMSGDPPLKALATLRQTCPNVRVLVLTMHSDPAYLRAAQAAGCHGYLLKSAVDKELVSAISQLAQ